MSALVQRLLAAGLLAATAGAGIGWGLAAHDRNQAQAELAVERRRADDLGDQVREQNRAVDALAAAKTAAEARGATARQLAAANGKRYDAALVRLADARATTCDEAMPAVNQLLESVR
ncbi:hypothetical protein [Janthinobacterium fluminis]|uniref:Bacteriophage Rz lysis protein n=1 Tax=Janthinobacterium fluminis TaxID=2987524 RepID=A0ABT5JU71_9BURK|nr:hypothetical protein [Janthinobacterium fluminis]MDC8756275.1 hypothetical protein [Janthinobacterium fluminis]